MKDPNQEENETPDWLKQVQNLSWEPEILISGGSIIFLFTMTEDLGNWGKLANHVSSSVAPIIMFLSLIAINIIKLAFCSHLLLRGVWTGLVGLSYVYPKGIDKSKLKLRGRFQKDLDNVPALSSKIIKLEKICSMIFSFTFTFATMFAGFVLFFMLVMQTFDLMLPDLRKYWGLFKLGMFVLVLLGLIEFFTGFFKRTKYLSAIYYPIYRVLNILTLGFLYRNTYYIFSSNLNKSLIVLFFFAISVPGYFLASANMRQIYPYQGMHTHFLEDRLYRVNPKSSQYSLRSDRYDNLRKEGAPVSSGFPNFSINSDIYHKGPIKLFIAYDKALDQFIDPNCKSADSYKEPETLVERARMELEHLNCIASLFTIQIDDSTIVDIEWLYVHHPSTGQDGIVCYLPLKSFKQGIHSIKILTDLNKKKLHVSSAPFWIE